MSWGEAISIASTSILAAGCVAAPPIRRWLRRKLYTRGRKLSKPPDRELVSDGYRPWGAHGVSPTSCRQHMIAAATSGSGKSLLLRRTLKPILLSIAPGSDRRVFAADTENDVIPYLRQIGVTCPVYSLNPLESRTDFPISVRWDVSKDITNPAKSLNLVAKFVTDDGAGGNGKFFVDSARILLWAVVNSFNRHSPGEWTFSDLVFAALSADRVIEILNRDQEGREDLAGVFRDAENMNVTADNIFSTLYSKMAFHRPVAALWQRATQALSIRDWVKSDSILLLGFDESMEEAFDLINGMIFRTFVEEASCLSNSTTREMILWLDELRSCKAILQSEKLNNFVLRLRKKGGIFMGGFQDIEGFRHAAGSPELANEIIGQCSHKILGRLESPETADWASALLGKYETIEIFESHQGEIGNRQRSVNEQRILKDNVLPSEFFAINEPSPETGVEAYFLSPGRRPYRALIDASEFHDVVVSDEMDRTRGIKRRADSEQTLTPWTHNRRRELGLKQELQQEVLSKLDLQSEQSLTDIRDLSPSQSFSSSSTKLLPFEALQLPVRDHNSTAI